MGRRSKIYCLERRSLKADDACATVLPGEHMSLVSYRGTLTSQVDESIFILDGEDGHGSTRKAKYLYLSQHASVGGILGLRVGAHVLLRNVHVINFEGHVNGFATCIASQIQILHFSEHKYLCLGVKRPSSNATLSSYAQQLCADYALLAWIVTSAQTLYEKFGGIFGNRWHSALLSSDFGSGFLPEIASWAHLDAHKGAKGAPNVGDWDQFIEHDASSLHRCSLYAPLTLSIHAISPADMPVVLPLRLFVHHIEEMGRKAEAEGEQCSLQAKRKASAGFATFEISLAEISLRYYASRPILLLGWLHGCRYTGRLVFRDCTGSIHVCRRQRLRRRRSR